jgi:hypothetical protein
MRNAIQGQGVLSLLSPQQETQTSSRIKIRICTETSRRMEEGHRTPDSSAALVEGLYSERSPSRRKNLLISILMVGSPSQV